MVTVEEVLAQTMFSVREEITKPNIPKGKQNRLSHLKECDCFSVNTECISGKKEQSDKEVKGASLPPPQVNLQYFSGAEAYSWAGLRGSTSGH